MSKPEERQVARGTKRNNSHSGRRLTVYNILTTGRRRAAMNDNSSMDWPELSQQVAEAQTRIFLKLVFDLWEALEKYDQYSIRNDPRTAERKLSGRAARGIL